MSDRVGIGFRPELAAGIVANLESIDVLEVIADDYVDAPERVLRPFDRLAAHVPIVLHGVGLGLASASPVDRDRLKALARLVRRLEPELWSEHLAFVRAGGIEIGHLAAPPRTDATIAGTVANLARIADVVGTLPHVENVATLIEPLGEYDEATWLSAILDGSGAPWLLDLHNLHANAQNFGYEALDFLRLPAVGRVSVIHVAGGKWISAAGTASQRRLLDDHLHPVPDPVFALLEEAAFRVTQPLTVILERDGAYPQFAELCAELDAARAALARGRERRRLARKGGADAA